jgi:hypothetical protein
MSIFTTSLARLTRLTLLARHGRPAGAALLAAGALAAGCGAVHASAASGPAGGAAASAHATPSQQAAPVPTVTGGAVAGQSGCVGWPAHPTRVTMSALFVPVAVERCVTSIQTISGKGQWETATLEKATSDLTPLIAALRHPPVTHTPETFCPALAMLPPQIVLISASGQEVIPLLPVTGCGLVQSAVLSAIAVMPWHPVSVRLIAPVPTAVQGEATRQATLSPKTVHPLPEQQGVVPQ